MSTNDATLGLLGGDGSLGREVQDHLGALLRTALAGSAAEPLPERLLALVAQVEHALAERGRTTTVLRAEMLAIVPGLRNFAISLTRDPDRADDLVQETLVRALRHLDQFAPGTNLGAWLFTIARNQFNSTWRRARREVPDPDAQYAGRLAVAPDQIDKIALRELRSALDRLPRNQREALLLTVFEGRSIEEAARVLGTAEGTIKSRVHRARSSLSQQLGIHDEADFGVDQVTRAALG